jgi:hypothetical protein
MPVRRVRVWLGGGWEAALLASSPLAMASEVCSAPLLL